MTNAHPPGPTPALALPGWPWGRDGDGDGRGLLEGQGDGLGKEPSKPPYNDPLGMRFRSPYVKCLASFESMDP